MRHLSDRRVATPLLLLAVTILWPLQELAGGQLGRGGYHLGQVVVFRYIAHLMILLAVVLPWHGLKVLRTRRPGLQLLRGLCMFGMPAGYLLAIDFGANAWIWTVFWLSPLLAIAGAALLLGERSPPVGWILALAGAGGAAAVMGVSPATLLSTLFALVMGGSFAGYLILSRRLRGESLAASLFYTAVGALTPMLLLVWRVWTPVAPGDLIAIALTGLLGIGILAFLDLVADEEPVWKSAVFLPQVVVWEVLLSVMVRDHAIGSGDTIGSALILLSTAIAVWAIIRWRAGMTRIEANAASSPVLDVHHG